MENLALNNKAVILKSNILIDSSYKLTLQEQRILNIACKKLKPLFVEKNKSINEFKAYAETKAFELIEIGVKDYLGEYSTKSKSVYKDLEKVATSLYKKEIIYFDENDDLTRKRWVITCKYKEKQGKIALKFHPDLVTDLLVFQGNYTQLNYAFLNSVKSFYASRMYELLRQYLTIGKRTFELEELRFKLGLIDTEYPKYANFKQRVLKPSIDWINNNSDIDIEFIEDKCGTRSVKKITFKITSKARENIKDNVVQLSLQVDEEESAFKKIREIVNIPLTAEQVQIICDATAIGLSQNNLKDIKTLDYIKSKWETAKAYANKSESPNYIGALIQSLKNNWGGNTMIENIDNNNNKNKKVKKPKLKFNNYKGREYTDEEWNGIEHGLLDSSLSGYI